MVGAVEATAILTSGRRRTLRLWDAAFPAMALRAFISELYPLKQLSDALVFRGGGPIYNRLFQRVLTTRKYIDAPNRKGHIWRKTANHSSKTADVASFPVILESQFN